MDKPKEKSIREPAMVGLFSSEGQRYLREIIQIIDLRNYSNQNGASAGTVEPDEMPGEVMKNPVRYGCNVCSFECDDLSNQRNHFQSEWHLFNLRRRLKSKLAISEETYERIVSGEQDAQKTETTCSSSSSSSDEDEGDEQSAYRQKSNGEKFGIKGSVVVFLTNDNRVISCYRSVLTALRSYQISNELLLSELRPLHSGPCVWIVLILSGGHFAGAVFDSSSRDALVHKTIHRYTTRSKQGCSQSVRDAQQQSKPKSAGANLRRYNEAALCKDIRNLLTSWGDHVRCANAIYLRCSVYKRHIFYGGPEAVFSKADQRIRNIPFATRKPTYEEAKRVWSTLATLEVYDSYEQFLQCRPKDETEENGNLDDVVTNVSKVRLERKPKQLSEKDGNKNASPPAPTDDDKNDDATAERKSRRKKSKESPRVAEFALPQHLRQQLYTSCKCGDAESIRRVIEGHQSETQAILDYLSAPVNSKDGSTFLHLASASGHVELLRSLLEFGCSPLKKNAENRVPFQVAQGKNARHVFIQFRQDHPSRWDWNAAQIPIPLPIDPEVEAARKAVLAERRKVAMKVKAEKQKAKKEAEAQEKAEEEEKKRFLQLSDREKRALAAESRWKTQLTENSHSEGDSAVLSRCFKCGTDITGKKPFEYCDNRFCSVKCLQDHRSRNGQ